MGIIFHRCHDNMRKYDERALCNLIIESLVRFYGQTVYTFYYLPTLYIFVLKRFMVFK